MRGGKREAQGNSRRKWKEIVFKPFWQYAFFLVTVLEIIQKSTTFLRQKQVESPRLQSELLLGHILKTQRLNLYLDFQRTLSSVEVDVMRGLVQRRSKGEPLQHIMGTVSFCGLEIKVSPEALIPRPETELLAERGWTFMKSRSAGGLILDFGTGTGCLAIACVHFSPLARAFAIDISESALTLARENAAAHRLEDKIQFIWSDGFQNLTEKNFSLILANPPYIRTEEIARLPVEVREHDPLLALDGGLDGLRFYRLLAEQAKDFLEPGGKIMAEFGDDQGESIRRIFEENGWAVEDLAVDYTGRLRILIAGLAKA